MFTKPCVETIARSFDLLMSIDPIEHDTVPTHCLAELIYDELGEFVGVDTFTTDDGNKYNVEMSREDGYDEDADLDDSGEFEAVEVGAA